MPMTLPNGKYLATNQEIADDSYALAFNLAGKAVSALRYTDASIGPEGLWISYEDDAKEIDIRHPFKILPKEAKDAEAAFSYLVNFYLSGVLAENRYNPTRPKWRKDGFTGTIEELFTSGDEDLTLVADYALMFANHNIGMAEIHLGRLILGTENMLKHLWHPITFVAQHLKDNGMMQEADVLDICDWIQVGFRERRSRLLPE